MKSGFDAVSQSPADPVDVPAVRESARAHAIDRYTAALFAPADARPDLIALAAFTGEVERISQIVTDPQLGEIRLAWWRDTLLERSSGGLTGNPILDAIAAVIRRRQMAQQEFTDYLEAHAHVLYAAPPADRQALMHEIKLIDGTPLRLAAQILATKLDEAFEQTLKAATNAIGTCRLCRDLPFMLSRGRSPIPGSDPENIPSDGKYWRSYVSEMAADAQAELANIRAAPPIPKQQRTAILPVALVEPYFRALKNPQAEPARDIVEIAPLSRLWHIARVQWSGRV